MGGLRGDLLVLSLSQSNSMVLGINEPRGNSESPHRASGNEKSCHGGIADPLAKAQRLPARDRETSARGKLVGRDRDNEGYAGGHDEGREGSSL